MLDFLFFDAGIAQRFADEVKALGHDPWLETTPEGGISVCVAQAGLSDAQREALEAVYEPLFFGDQAALVEGGDPQADACGVQIYLSTGEYTTVLLEPEIMNGLLSVFTPEQVQQLFARIADAVENPNACSVCRAMEDDLLAERDE